MKRLLISFCICMLMASAPLAQPGRHLDPVEDCPMGLVCLLPAEAVNIRMEVINLREELEKLKAKRLKRFGHCAGVGVGPAYADELEFSGFAGYMFGFRWNAW